MKTFRKLILVAAVSAASTASVSLRADDHAAQLRTLLEARAPSIVSVRAVIRMEINFGGGTQNDESRVEFQGAVVDEGGLILVSNSNISPSIPGLSDGFEIKVVPLEFKVVFEREEKEYDAFLAAKDTKLNLAFLQIKELGDRKLVPIGFEESAKPAIGEEIVSVTRLEKGYDYAPFFSVSRVSGKIRKPRRALVFTGSLQGVGLPVFTPGGAVVGVVTQLESGIVEDTGGRQNPMRMLARLSRGGGLGGGETFILPAKSIKGVVAQAIKKAGELLAEQEKESESEDEASESDS